MAFNSSLMNWLVGYDIFISYSRRDAAAYAARLGSELTARRFSCRLDQWGAQPGAAVPGEMLRTVRRSSMFVLVGTAGGATSSAVESEIREFLNTKKYLVPIDLDGSIWRAHWWHLIEGLAVAEEPRPNGEVASIPSQGVLDRIENTASFTRRSTRLRRTLTVGLLGLIVLSVLAWTEGRRLVIATRTANNETAVAQQMRADADAQRTKADQAIASAKQAIAARENADRERGVAERATELAESEREIQQVLARSIARLADDPEASILLALKAVQLSRDPESQTGRTAMSQLHAAVVASRIRVRFSPHSEVTGGSWSGDGKRVVVATADGRAVVYDSETGRMDFSFAPGQDGVDAIAWSRDGRFIATGGRDSYARIWNGANGAPISEFRVNMGEIRSVAWNADSESLAIGGAAVCIWELGTTGCKPYRTALAGIRNALCVEWSPNGELLAIGSQDYHAYVWSRKADKLVAVVGGSDYVRSVAWKPDGTQLATDDFFKAAIWNIPQGTLARSLPKQRGYITGLSWDRSGEAVATASDRAKVSDANTGAELFQLAGHRGRVKAISWSPDGRRILTVGDDQTARIWDATPGGAELRTFTASSLTPSMTDGLVDWSPDGRAIAAAGSTLTIWNVNTGRVLSQIDVGNSSSQYTRFDSLKWEPHGTTLAANILPESIVGEWDATTGARKVTFDPSVVNCSALGWSPDKTRIATAHSLDDIIIWSSQTGRIVGRFAPARQFFNSIEWNPRLPLLLTASRDASVTNDTTQRQERYDAGISIWSLHKAKELLRMQIPKATVATWSPDGERIAVAGGERIQIIQWRTRKVVAELIGHVGTVFTISWSPDGRYIASGGADMTTRVWQALEAREVLTLSGHLSSIESVRWSPDGMRLASLSGDGVVQIYALSGKELIALAKTRVTRSLTEAECEAQSEVNICRD